ncbi:GerW family sporulation protein [Rufibacter radiotolerans]|uniref:GerW family sporulation protein n=1 Tax=Rufibacter radiotolerans TaxID=1379910 RepID=UPI0018CD3503|nr:spore germination protein GerW family protein [Rufibacter radiotolerans]
MMPDSTLEEHNIGSVVAASLNQNASIKNIFGEPIETQGKTIIPVAQVAMGLGGGYGQGNKKTEAGKDASGEGAGGGLYAVPKGVFEVTAKKTRFIPVSTSRPFLLGAGLGFLLGWLLFNKRAARS